MVPLNNTADTFDSDPGDSVDSSGSSTLKEVKQLTADLGRAPKILHIGNIANNAYNNAKLLNKLGFVNDVICYDYYHIMGCPEWEDADFDNTVEDDFRPDWTKVNVSGFERPRWFAQGPLELCVAYLIARRQDNGNLARILWKELGVCNKTQNYKSEASFNPTFLNPRYLSVLARHKITVVWRYVAYEGSSKIQKILFGDFDTSGENTRTGDLSSRIAKKPPLRFALKVLFWFMLQLKSLIGSIGRVASRLISRVFDNSGFEEMNTITSSENAEKICADFEMTFPNREPKLEPKELKPYFSTIHYWIELFSHYDLIIGYATDPILPYLVGKPYYALEHGTLREIPFDNDTRGKLTALSYSRAEHVFVTNFDCLKNAQILSGERHTFVNHPYDEDRSLTLDADALREQFKRELDAEFLVFFPTRQDWVTGTGYADKANDVFIRAFCRLRNEGIRIGMIACDWGKNVNDSKSLLSEHGCDTNVSWMPPMAIVRFEKVCAASDLVADQFMLGAFGGVTFKSLAAGVPVCTYLNESILEGLYGELPPVLNCKTEDDVYTQIKILISSNEELQRARKASRQWIEKYHSGKDLAEMQAKKFIEVLSTQ